MKKLFFVIIFSLFLFFYLSINADSSDDQWISMNEFSGTDSNVNAVLRHGDDLYIGGLFKRVKNVEANFIAKLHIPSGEWNALGGGLNGMVDVLAVDMNGNVYAGGNFYLAGSKLVNNIAKWNGTNWSSLGSGMSGDSDISLEVLALVFDKKGDLYAGGNFTNAGGVTVNYIAKWDGSKWSSLGKGLDGFVKALAVDESGNIYAGGCFKKAGDITVNGLAKWDGNKWSSIGDGVDACVLSIRFDNEHTLYVSGSFETAGGVTVNSIAKWSGTEWSEIGGGMKTYDFPESVYVIEFDSENNLYAGGYFKSAGGIKANNIAKWDGAEWSTFGSGMSNENYGAPVYAIYVEGPDDFYAAGQFLKAGDLKVGNITKWKNGKWNALGKGIGGKRDSEVYALATDSKENLYAGGYFTTTGDSVSNDNIAIWNGKNWNALKSGANGHVLALAVDDSDILYAGGSFETMDGLEVNNIAKWDGEKWVSLGSGFDRKVNALAVDSKGTLYAGGWFYNPFSYIAKWDGAEWVELGNGLNDWVEALVVDSKDHLYAGGWFGVAKWDGNVWSDVGIGVNGYVFSLAVDNQDNLYVGGDITDAGGVSVNNVAKWDGTKWNALGNGIAEEGNPEFEISSLAVDSVGNLYAGGDFGIVQGIEMNCISRWNGKYWSSLGSGVYDWEGFPVSVSALVIDNADHFYVGGEFVNAGNKISPYVAKYIAVGEVLVSDDDPGYTDEEYTDEVDIENDGALIDDSDKKLDEDHSDDKDSKIVGKSGEHGCSCNLVFY